MTIPPETLDLRRCIGAVVSSLANRISSGASREYRARFGIGSVEWRILCQIAAEPDSTGAELVTALGLDKAAVSRSMHFLESQDLLVTRADFGRRRRTRLTAEGQRLHRAVLEIARAREADLLHGLSAAEIDQTLDLLGRLSENLAAVEANALARLEAKPEQAKPKHALSGRTKAARPADGSAQKHP